MVRGFILIGLEVAKFSCRGVIQETHSPKVKIVGSNPIGNT